MAKKIIGNLKLRIPAGRATAGPPVGSTLGQLEYVTSSYQ